MTANLLAMSGSAKLERGIKMHNMEPITVDDLRTGKRARITEAECAQITGRKRYSLQRDRWLQKGMRYQKDENGRIWYSAKEVLTYIDGRKHRSTAEYDTSALVLRLSKAREAKAAAQNSATTE